MRVRSGSTFGCVCVGLSVLIVLELLKAFTSELQFWSVFGQNI